MSRYIEQDYIGSAVAHLPTKTLQTEHGIELVVPVTDVIEIIKNAPSIDIVRCGECKWQGFYRHCRYFRDIDFCPHGERDERSRR